jgi:hypothetical protein
MPSGINPVPMRTHGSRQTGPSKAGVGLRVRTWWQRDRLDEKLSRGADPAARPELTLRALQLCTPETRAQLSAAIETIVREARGRPGFPLAALSLRRAEVRAATADLLVLAARLRDTRAIDAQGAAMTRLLVTDGRSPVYEAGKASDLGRAVQLARLALDPVAMELDTLHQAA